MKKQLLAAASVASIAFAGLAFAAPAQAGACTDGVLFVNTQTELLQFNAEGVQVGTAVTLADTEGYGDIAITSDLATVYGLYNQEPWADPNINEGSPNGDVVSVVNPTTGAVTSTFLLSGPANGIGSWVGAAMLPSGELAIGSGTNAKVYKVDVTTGASTEWVDMSTVDPNITYNMGDFARLPDGDEIAIGATSSTTEATLVRIHPDGTMTVAGTIPNAWGAGRVGDSIMVSGDAMHSFKISEIPASGTSAIPSVQLNTFDQAWGAAGSQDAATEACDPTLPNTGVNAGALGALAAGLGLAGAAGVVIARRKRA